MLLAYWLLLLIKIASVVAGKHVQPPAVVGKHGAVMDSLSHADWTFSTVRKWKNTKLYGVSVRAVIDDAGVLFWAALIEEVTVFVLYKTLQKITLKIGELMKEVN